MKQRSRAVITVIALTLLGTTQALALNEPTHELINEYAARHVGLNDTSAFDSFLRREMGLLKGLEEPVRGHEVFEWLRVGGRLEDDSGRFLRHFHDPLQPWETAGLRLLPQFASSVRWMQQVDQDWSWQRAVDYFYTALTLKVTSSEEFVRREQVVADAFRAVGQAMHLVVDASVPEHTRNDPHPLGAVYGNYEYWVGAQHGRRGSGAESTFINNFLTSPIGFDPAILRQPTGDDLAPVPIARVIDSGAYTGLDSGPGVTLSPAIGIAEFANANFFSEDTGNRTLLGRNYPFPSLDLLEASTHPAPLTGRARGYLRKQINPATGRAADGGLPVDPAMAECVLDEPARQDGIFEPRTYGCMDENVWAQTAREMLPRAMGYAKGTLHYFFRGRIEIAPPDRFVYALTPFTLDNSGAFTTLRFKIRNATPNEAAGTGTIVATVRYRTASGNLFEEPLAAISETRFVAVSTPQAVTLTDTFQELAFDFRGHPIPTNAADLFLAVVYRGPLGFEADAVAVGGKDIREPDPVVVINATDYDCFAGQPHLVAGLPPAARDLNGDRRQDLFGPHLERGVLVKVDLLNRRLTPSAQRFDFAIAEMIGGQFARFVALQDDIGYDVGLLSDELQDTSTGQIFRRFLRFFRLNGVVNAISLSPEGQIRRQVSFLPLQYRGLRLLHGVATTTNTGSSCFPLTFTLPPNVTEVAGSVAPE